MPTVLLFVTCSSSPQPILNEQSEDPILQTIKQALVSVTGKILENHPFEDISMLNFDGVTTSMLQHFTHDLSEIQQSMNIVKSLKYEKVKSITKALIDVFVHVQESIGLHTHTQIIIFTDSSPFPDNVFKIRPQFPAKLHFFCVNSALQAVSSSSSMPSSASTNASEPVASSSTTATASSSSDQQHSGTVSVAATLKQFASLNKGSCITLAPGSEKMNRSISKFIRHHYDKYLGYLAFGHLVSAIDLHPDPNLTLWEDDSGADLKVPPALSIIGFLNNNHISAPKCISKHTILQTERKVMGKKGKKKRKREETGGFSSIEAAAASSKKPIIKADACKADPSNSSFFELLHLTLLKMKLCAIVHFYDNQYAYISVAHEQTHSALILGIMDKHATDWLRSDIHSIVTHTIRDNYAHSLTHFEQQPKEEEEDGLFYKQKNQKIYSLYVKNSASSVPFLKSETLQNDFQKIYRNLKALPAKAQTLFAECEKIQKTSNVYMNDNITATLIAFLKEQSAQLLDNSSKLIVQVLVDQLQRKQPLECPDVEIPKAADVAMVEEPPAKRQRTEAENLG